MPVFKETGNSVTRECRVKIILHHRIGTILYADRVVSARTRTYFLALSTRSTTYLDGNF